ncbi:MAG TPA: lytic murein transglycosylase B [Gammaproteobacteria bacterium]|nr:lytic murein transglycosylase B [Gammaproteobacteria bacterium]
MTALGIARRILVVGGLLTAFASAAQAPDPAAIATARKAFVDRMVRQHQFDRADLAALLDQVQINQTIIDTMSKPAERVVPWFEYRRIFLTEERIAAGVQFWREHARELDSVSQRFGVAPEMIVAIVGVETYFGTRMGKYRVLDALATLAFAYPPRASFFASELEQFLLLTREEHIDPRSALGSYAGAMGAGQFIPSSYRAYAVDANDDGKRDLWSDWEDALGSVANYFRMHGWKTGDPVVEQATLAPEFKGPDTRNSMDLKETVGSLRGQGYVFTTDLPAETPAAPFALEAEGGGSEYWVGFNNFRVITRYNRSPKYALAAFELSRAIRTRYSTAVASNVGSIDR